MKRLLISMMIIATTITGCKKDITVPDSIKVDRVRTTTVTINKIKYTKDEFFIISPSSINVNSDIPSDSVELIDQGNYVYSYITYSANKSEHYTLVIDNGKETINYNFVRK